MAIVIIPGSLMFIMGIVGNDPLEHVAKVVFDQAGLEFHGGEGGGRADDEEMDQAGNAQVGQALLQLGGDVDDVVIPFGGEFEGESLHDCGCSRFLSRIQMTTKGHLGMARGAENCVMGAKDAGLFDPPSIMGYIFPLDINSHA